MASQNENCKGIETKKRDIGLRGGAWKDGKELNGKSRRTGFRNGKDEKSSTGEKPNIPLRTGGTKMRIKGRN